jgi:hypothetical protein
VSDHLKRLKLKGWILVLWAVIGAILLTAADPTSSTATISTSSTGPSFTEFESGQVRPLAISPDRTKLFAVNTPDNTLEIFNITSEGLALRARVPVGLEPVAVAARNDHEVWVVNHLSDSVSVVSLANTPRVTRTLLVGDEPRDIVFAGTPSRAFIATAHRGQQRTDPSIASVPGALDTPLNGTGQVDDFHSMKGPMTTQTLRGLRNSGAMHWRGDRANGAFGVDPFDAELSFNNFIVAFDGLVGSPNLPSAAEMQRFTDFQLQVLTPPNPVRSLDNSLTASQQRGRDFYFGPRPADGVVIPNVIQLTFSCNGCHVLDPAQGFFGTGRNASFENHTQIVKIPHLRNQYTKAGMFGAPKVNFFDAPNSGFTGDQIRGFGFLHDGSTDTLFHFLTASVFRPQADIGFPLTDPDATRRDVEQFSLAFDNDLAPIVGQQVTLSQTNIRTAGPRIDLLIQQFGGVDTVHCRLSRRTFSSHGNPA